MAMPNWPSGRKTDVKTSCSSLVRTALQRRHHGVPMPIGRSFVESLGSLNRAKKRRGERRVQDQGVGGHL
jgi:hypothetical protein